MSYKYGDKWYAEQRKRAEPLHLSNLDWDFEARGVERRCEEHLRRTLYTELAGLMANYVLRALWGSLAPDQDAASRIGRLYARQCTFEVFALCDKQREYPIGKLVVKLRHAVANPAKSAARWKYHFGRNALAWGRKLRPKLSATEAGAKEAYARKVAATTAKTRREARLVQRAPALFDELEKLTD